MAGLRSWVSRFLYQCWQCRCYVLHQNKCTFDRLARHLNLKLPGRHGAVARKTCGQEGQDGPLVVCVGILKVIALRFQNHHAARHSVMTRVPGTPPSTAPQCMFSCTRRAARSACAVIPTRKNARPWLKIRPGAQARNEILRGTRHLPPATRRLSRAIWRRWSGSQRQSLAETKMRCFKLLGERVPYRAWSRAGTRQRIARDFERQGADLQITAAILNRFTALGTPQTLLVGSVSPEEGKTRSQADLGNRAPPTGKIALCKQAAGAALFVFSTRIRREWHRRRMRGQPLAPPR